MTAGPEKRILLIIGGGIAAYKALELIRRLRGQGFFVRAVMTGASKEFVTKLSAESLTGNKVYDDLFALTDESGMGHIELSRDADLLVVAPATADLIAKMAHGLAGDLASTLLLGTLLAPTPAQAVVGASGPIIVFPPVNDFITCTNTDDRFNNPALPQAGAVIRLSTTGDLHSIDLDNSAI